MQETYEKAIEQVFKDEGGYTDNTHDPGGPTNWGITIHDAQAYWKADATAEDVKDMPKSVAEDIYRKHYADAIGYNSLPAGVDYAVLDYAINSGVVHALEVYNSVKMPDPTFTINALYAQRLQYLQQLHTWPIFGKGWTARCTHGQVFALSMVTKSSPSFFQSILNFFSKGK